MMAQMILKNSKELGRKTQLSEKQVVIRDRSLSSKEDFGLTISNRAGMLEKAEHSIMPLKKTWSILVTIPAILFLWITTAMF